MPSRQAIVTSSHEWAYESPGSDVKVPPPPSPCPPPPFHFPPSLSPHVPLPASHDGQVELELIDFQRFQPFFGMALDDKLSVQARASRGLV